MTYLKDGYICAKDLKSFLYLNANGTVLVHGVFNARMWVLERNGVTWSCERAIIRCQIFGHKLVRRWTGLKDLGPYHIDRSGRNCLAHRFCISHTHHNGIAPSLSALLQWPSCQQEVDIKEPSTILQILSKDSNLIIEEFALVTVVIAHANTTILAHLLHILFVITKWTNHLRKYNPLSDILSLTRMLRLATFSVQNHDKISNILSVKKNVKITPMESVHYLLDTVSGNIMTLCLLNLVGVLQKLTIKK